ncbi:MAG TPA: hypothetical protein VFL29_07045, partial [Candidatus Dormibacteraeota bacterium]|nr:hypothetical protein [Candidatus Dormibacteraeota bacterium]
SQTFGGIFFLNGQFGADDGATLKAALMSVLRPPAEVVKAAYARGVVIRHLPGGWLRASVGWWNDEGDIQRLVQALRDGL